MFEIKYHQRFQLLVVAIRNRPYMSNLAYLHKQNQKGFWKAKIYPSGDFTIGKNQPPKVDSQYQPLEGIASHKTFYGATKVSIPARQLERDVDPANLERIALDYEQAGNHEKAAYFGDRYASEILSGKHAIASGEHLTVDGDDFGSAHMGLSDAINSHRLPPRVVQKRAKRGTRGITAYNKRMVKSCCFLLERDHSKNCLSFLTATLPAFASPSDLKLICSSWSELIRQMVQELRRLLARRGYCTDMVYITEIQEDRYANSGEVAPHLHLVMVGKKSRWQKGYAISKLEVRLIWERLLSNILGRKITCIAATRVERPKKSLQGELGSYLSKGGKMIEQIIKDGHGDQLPSSYVGANLDLKNAVKAEIKVLTGIEAQEFVDSLTDMRDAGLVYFKPIMWQIPASDRDIAIGFVGWVRKVEIVCQFLQVA